MFRYFNNVAYCHIGKRFIVIKASLILTVPVKNFVDCLLAVKFNILVLK
jgi:hypothetical protein